LYFVFRIKLSNFNPKVTVSYLKKKKIDTYFELSQFESKKNTTLDLASSEVRDWDGFQIITI